MIEHPEQYIDSFAKAGADLITIHREAVMDPESLLENIKQHGCKAGISINPETSFDTVRPLIPLVDLVLIMSVHPGFSGQKFIIEVVSKIKEAAETIQKAQKQIYLQVDGGITAENAGLVKRNGADVLVAASFIFKSTNYKTAIDQLKKAL
jgi:ribulose-phosphate 3-epimerase